MPCLTLILALLAVALSPPSAAASEGAAAQGPGTRRDPHAWRAPVQGPVVGEFTYSSASPFARGARRGTDFEAPRGVVVRSACTGLVVFAGRVPGRAHGVTVRCGALVATHLGLASLAVRRGQAVAIGWSLGRAGRSGRVRLGARRAGDRFGYIDPETLFASALRELPPTPTATRPRGGRRPVRAARRFAVRAAHAPQSRSAPLLVWLGVMLLAAAVGTGGLVRHRARRHRTPVRIQSSAASAPRRISWHVSGASPPVKPITISAVPPAQPSIAPGPTNDDPSRSMRRISGARH